MAGKGAKLAVDLSVGTEGAAHRMNTTMPGMIWQAVMAAGEQSQQGKG
jgi:hypothetical protein